VSNETGSTALHYAAGFHSLAIVEKLLGNGADFNARDGCNRSVLYFAAMSSDEEKFKTILDNLPDSERKASLAAVVPAALKARSTRIFEIITNEEGIDLEVPDRSGWTGLDIATCSTMSHEVEILKEKGTGKEYIREEPTQWSFHDREEHISLSQNRMEAWMEGRKQGMIAKSVLSLTKRRKTGLRDTC
jgi:hypothetical protein